MADLIWQVIDEDLAEEICKPLGYCKHCSMEVEWSDKYIRFFYEGEDKSLYAEEFEHIDCYLKQMLEFIQVDYLVKCNDIASLVQRLKNWAENP